MASVVYGQADALLGMTADTTGVSGVGGEFTLQVILSNAQNVGGVIFTVYFDPSVLQIIKNDKGYSVTENPAVYDPALLGGNPNYRGDGDNYTRMDGDAGGRNFGATPVWLGKIRFVVLKEAETQVSFSYHKLSTPFQNGVYPQPIAHQTQGIKLLFDFTPPAVTSFNVPVEVLGGSMAQLTAQGSEKTGLEYCRFEYSADGVTWQLIGEGQPVWQADGSSWQVGIEWNTSGLGLGTYRLRVTVRDLGGHVAEAEAICMLVGGSVQGRVYLEGLPPGEDAGGIKIYVPGTVLQTFTDISGSYSLGSLPAGSYRLIAARPGFLDQAADLLITVENPNVAAGYILLPTGDITGDNMVDIDDLLVLRQDYGSGASRSDLDRSGLVNIRDLVLLARNYTKNGVTFD